MLKHLLEISDWTSRELEETLQLASQLKVLAKKKETPPLLQGKSYALIFYKNSLRTRVSFEVGIFQLGGQAIMVNESDFALGKRESIPDVAKALSRFVDGILIRTYSHQDVLTLSMHATVPVINMLTDDAHPCQILADAMTIQECLGGLKDKKIVYLGDGNNITHSLLNLASRIPMHLVVATAPNCLPNMELFGKAKQAGISQIEITTSAEEAALNADVLYTDVWASMGQKEQLENKISALKPYQINQSLLKLAKPGAIVMHCLPAERGREITDEVLDGPQSVVWEQAENRLHIQKAILSQLDAWKNTDRSVILS